MSTTYATRTIPTTSYNWRTIVSTSYNWRTWIWYIMTQLLDFLVTESWDYIINDNSINTNYTTRPII